jgi:hypothetical protein
MAAPAELDSALGSPEAELEPSPLFERSLRQAQYWSDT